MRTRAWWFVVVLSACGDDGAAPIDAPIDVAVDMAIDAPPPPVGHTHYVIDKFTMPTSNSEARASALDLNGDQVVDNQLGMVLATMTGQGFNFQASTTLAVDRGTSITLVDVAAAAFTDATPASLALFAGANPTPPACAGGSDTTCRHHFTGSASFTALATPVNPPLAGSFVAGTFLGGPGALDLDLVWPNAAPTRLHLIGARAKVTLATPLALGEVVLAGAISQTEVDAKVYPAMQSGFMAAVTRDCTALSSPPMCGCAANSDGKTALDLFDAAPKDCAVTLAEVKNNSLIQALLAPDVTIDGVQALSFGVRATAVGAAFATP